MCKDIKDLLEKTRYMLDSNIGKGSFKSVFFRRIYIIQDKNIIKWQDWIIYI